MRKLHEQDETPVKQVLECPREKKEVPWEHAVKGFEIHKDRYVLVTEADLEAAAPVASRTIAVREFVPFDQIDPACFERAYWLGPDDVRRSFDASLVVGQFVALSPECFLLGFR